MAIRLPQNHAKALIELWNQAGELGKASAYHNIGYAYFNGEGVVRDEKKANHYWEKAAMLGHAESRNTLGATKQNKYHHLRGRYWP